MFTSEDLDNLHIELCAKANSIMKTKNHDYSGASGDPFANFRGSTFLGISPEIGILLRCQDKFQRIRTFVNKGELAVKEESVMDAVVDTINYMVLLAGLMREQQLDKVA